ncbi:response regulator transcription factor [Solitalea canadensis]|uniref:Response regulator with CheY-like receiver domain and winged-helix DNA-binding domain n=1 Tax=Solitalea canadensis (strain ATCC 29591 / DSM 3403 / JCM 21819 / LMG 8368 / NBRC 15130 / NCIMB 12057 / USAM 9D) TaxID=929556 RepID=H8KVB3_SOLCM|nr:response regulator transcription factor [Solitalea canadensis]AFD06171.1 response regulator with CheY-like receiver domain and winged-helix DNA-binding domain [Solitalea canadensis DSM 3403]
MKLLIIEDEPALNQSIKEFLTSQFYLCETVTNYHDALEKINFYEYDCIVLDINLPGGSGLQLLQHLKTQNKTDGVIIISARNELDDKLTGFQLGADDYLTKPFHLSELSMRIAAIIRRKSMNGSNNLTFNEITLDTQSCMVYINNQELILTRKEYDLLLYFIINKNRVLSKTTIAEHLWGDDMDIADNFDFIYTHVKNLRKKLILAGANDYIHSVYGVGYKFIE